MKLSRSVFSVLLALVLLLSPVVAPLAPEAADVNNTNGVLEFQYRYGTNNLIQINTNLPSDTPLADFLVTDNGCVIDQSGNSVQWIGWIQMLEDNGTIVLTFHYNQAFEAGQTYVLPAGAIFGFTDGKTYMLDKNYTFTFDGSGWSMAAENPALTLQARWGTSNLLQLNTNLPADTVCSSFALSENGCSVDESANRYQQAGWVGMDAVGSTIVLSFHFNGNFLPGQTYFLPKGAVFGFKNGIKYTLDRDYTFYYDGNSWSEEPVLTLQCRWGAGNVLQLNTNLELDTPCKDFLVTDNDSQIDQSVNKYQQVGYISMTNVQAEDLIVLTFNFGSNFSAGQTYILPEGAIFGFSNGVKYRLLKEYTFLYDGTSWEECLHTEYTPDVKAPTCTEGGYTTYTCVCGKSYTDNATEATGHNWSEATCTAASTCLSCGATQGEALSHSYVAETTPADCHNDGKTVYTCSGCGDSYEEVIPAGHTIEYVAAAIPANCQQQGHDEYWHCTVCDAYFGDAEGFSQINPAWIYYTGEHVRPEGVAVCAVVPCVLCGEDSYGEACDRGEAPVCQDAPCVNCGEIVWGWGCNYNTGDEEVPLPLCQPGDCVYCGKHYEKLYNCENGAWAPCLDGECAYGCGKQFPATEAHTVTVCEGGLCEICWDTIEAIGHNYESVVTPPTAIKEGYTTYTCSGCGDSYISDHKDPIGIGELKFSGVTLTLENTLSMNFRASSDLFIADAYTDPYAVFTFGYETVTVSDYKIVDGKYQFTCYNITPSQMCDTVTATLYATLNGETVAAETMQYSVVAYCETLLAQTTDPEVKTLVVDLLYYGDATQLYTGYKYSPMATDVLTAEQKSLHTSAVPALNSVLNTKYATVDNSKASWKAATLILNDTVELRYRFAAESLEGVTAKIQVAGSTWIVDDFAPVAGKDGQYYVYFDQLPAHMMRETILITLYEGDTAISNTLSYSVETYASMVAESAREYNLILEMMRYGDAAKAYVS